MSRLFEPFQLGPLTLANRIVIAPMCQYSAQEGSATDWHLMHLGSLAMSGAALLILEASAVSPEGRISPQDLGLYSDENEAALKRVLTCIHTQSAMPIAIQLAHAGRKGSSQEPWNNGSQIAPTAPRGWHTVAPSAIPHAVTEVPPLPLDSDGLRKVVTDFAAAAKRASRLGLAGIELHMAHGYLLHQFLSPLSNHRTDAYGGSLENRMRLPLEVYDAVRAAVPSNMPVWARVSAEDWVPDGWNLESTIALALELKKRGSPAIHVSSGGLSAAQKIPIGPGYQVPLARRIKSETGLTTIAVGLITEAEQAEMILAEGDADAIALARAILYDPRWPWHAAAKLGGQVIAPKQYWRCQPSSLKTLFSSAVTGQR